MTRAVLAAVMCAGCAIGSNTMLVGSAREHRQIDTVVCVETRRGVCDRTVEVGRVTPARSFGAGGVVVPIGYAHVRGAPDSSRLAAGIHAEYLRGRGGLGIGGRAGLNGLVGASERMWSVPVTALGYWGVRAFSVFAGGGYTPFARVEGSTDMLHGPNVLAGARFIVLSAASGERATANLELSYTSLGELDIITTTIGFGFHL